MLLEPAKADIILIGPILVREVAEFHRLDDAIYNKRGAKAGSQTEEKHSSVLVASERLHRRVVNDLDWTLESGFEIEANPPLREVMGLGYRPIVLDRPWIPDGHHVVS